MDTAADSLDIEDEYNDESVEDEVKTMKSDGKYAVSGEMDTIADGCNNIMAFLQAVAVKAPIVATVPLSLHIDKRGGWVPQVVHSPSRPPIHPCHPCTSIPIRAHRSLERRRNANTKCVIPLTHRCGATQA